MVWTGHIQPSTHHGMDRPYTAEYTSWYGQAIYSRIHIMLWTGHIQQNTHHVMDRPYTVEYTSWYDGATNHRVHTMVWTGHIQPSTHHGMMGLQTTEYTRWYGHTLHGIQHQAIQNIMVIWATDMGVKGSMSHVTQPMLYVMTWVSKGPCHYNISSIASTDLRTKGSMSLLHIQCCMSWHECQRVHVTVTHPG